MMWGLPCPICKKDSELLSTTNQWKYNCPEHGRFNQFSEFMKNIKKRPADDPTDRGID